MYHRAALVALALSSVFLAHQAFAQPVSTGSPGPLAGNISIPVDEARVFAVPANVNTVVIGNPSIADVVFTSDRGGAIVTGKSFGSTNVLFLTTAGESVSSAQVSVVRSPGLVTVTHGDKRATFSCEPRCAPTQAIGDAPEATSPISAQLQERANAAASTAPAR